MDLHLLGPVEATLDGRPIPLGATKQRALLAMLALQPNSTVSVDRLVDGLWGEEPPATAPKMVQLYVSQLRRLFGEAEAQIVTHGRGYELRVDPEGVDAIRFERLVESAGRTGDAPGDIPREALALWRGAALANVRDEPFAAAEIRRLEELRLRASELAIEGDLAVGRNEEALAQLERLIEEHPLRERLHAQRLLALYRSGRQAEALEAYATARQRLVEAIGVEPGDELRDLQARILRQDASLTVAPQPDWPKGRDEPGSGEQPAPAAAPGPRRSGLRRRLLTAALASALLAGAVFGITRLTGGDGLDGVDAGAVGVIDPGKAEITKQYRAGDLPGALTAGAASVWVASPSRRTVSRIHPGGDRVETIDVGPAPVGLAFGGGSLWVAGGEDGAVAQVDPSVNRVVQRIPVGNGLRAVAVGYGAVWAATALDGEVVRVGLRSGRVTKRIAVGGHPGALAIGAGSVWVAGEESGTVARIDPRSGEIVEAIAVGNGPSDVAVGHGAVWSANRQDGTVSRIDPTTNRVTHTVPAGQAPGELAIGARDLWIGDESGAVLRFDPRKRAITDRVGTDSTPTGLAAVEGDIWVGAAAPPAAHRGGTLRVGSEPFDLDPADGSFNPGAVPVVELAYEGLLAYRREGGTAGARLVGELATAVPKPADGGRRYVFRLRRGIRYSNGAPVKAGDFRASLERMTLVTHDASLFESIEGASACRPAAGRCDFSRGIAADERARTVTIRLGRPDPELLQKLRFVALVPAKTPDRLLRARPPPGTGPYRIERVKPGRSAQLVRNRYFQAGGSESRPAGFADRIDVTMGAESRQVRAVERGRLDFSRVFDFATAERLAGLRTRLGNRLQSGSFAMTEYAWLNVKRPPFDDVRVRRALNLAVDRGRVVDLTGGPVTGAATCQVLPPGLPGYRPVCPFTAAPSPAGAWTAPDLAQAKRLVAAAGARGTTVRVWTWPARRTAALHLAKVLEKLGFQSRVRVFDDLGPSLEAAADSRQRPQIGLNGWIADSPESGMFVRSIVGCEAPFNLTRFCDRGLDAAIDRAESGTPEAGAAWQRIERRVAESAPVVPLTTRRSVGVTSSRVGNVQFHPVYGVLLDQMWVR